ncbi:MAG: hypothetical protein GY807_22035 [Gammaproteobacteria bacterium]|nr:hypothetical protein [Gammaproteobacteria bacterium]
MKISSKLVAHRGDMRYHPENTLPALQCAIEAGAQHIEFDIQYSRDLVPMLIHDFTLERTTGRAGTVGDYPAAELEQIPVLPAEQSLHNYDEVVIPTLTKTIELLNQHPKTASFVELKRHSMEQFGMQECVDRVIATLTSARFKWTLISFNQDALNYAKHHHGRPIGWALRHYDDQSRNTAHKLRPEFLFCNYKKLPLDKSSLWKGPWRWVVYDLQDPKLAVSLINHGVDMIETCCISDMLRTRYFGAINTNNNGIRKTAPRQSSQDR